MSKNPKTTGTIRDQLKSHGALLTKVQGLPSHPSQWKEDGIDHINVSMFAATQLGKWLNGRSNFPFQHPVLGQFRTIENLSMFVRSEAHNDNIRMMENFTKVRATVSRSGGLRKTTPNYRALMVHSIYVRVLLNETLMKLIIESELPFDSYSVNRETMLRQRFEPSVFLCAGYTEIRSALKERRPLNLSRFLDPGVSKNADIYEGFMNLLTNGEYRGTAPAIIERFEEQRWAAYDNWCEKQLAKKQHAAEAKEAKKRRDAEAAEAAVVVAETTEPVVEHVIEEVGGISTDIIDSTVEPETNYPEGKRWFNPVDNMTYYLVHLAHESVWLSHDWLDTHVVNDHENGRKVTLMPGQNIDQAVLFACWELGYFISNPVTGLVVYPEITTIGADVTLTSVKPAAFEKLDRIMREAASNEAVQELAAVPVAAIESVEAPAETEQFVEVASAVLEPGELIEEPAADEQFTIQTASDADIPEEVPVVVADSNAGLASLQDTQ